MVKVQEVRKRRALIAEPLAGWVMLEKLRQDPWQRLGPEKTSATSWAQESVLARLRTAPPEPSVVEDPSGGICRNCVGAIDKHLSAHGSVCAHCSSFE